MARKKIQGENGGASVQEARPAKRRKARPKAAVELRAGAVRLLDYQRRWVEDDSALKIVVKARQIGYSFAATLRALLRSLDRKTTWIFLSKGERQSRLLMEKVHEHIHSCGIVAQMFESTFFEGTSLRQLEVRFPNGSVIYGLPSNPDTARGYSGNVTLDEFAFHADAAKIYAALFPTITRGFSLEVISTPNGTQGKFYELAKAAGLVDAAVVNRQSGVGETTPALGLPAPDSRFAAPGSSWSSHWCDIYDAIRQGLKINIELLRSGCDDEATWQQEFCCQFVSSAENFFPPELLAACLSAEASADTSPRLLASTRGAELRGVVSRQSGVGSPEGRASESESRGASFFPPTCDSRLATPDFFLGIDVGRQHDRTVFWLDEVTDSEVGNRESGVGSRESEKLLTSTTRDSRLATAERLSIARMVRTLDRAPFAEQLALGRELLALRRPDGTPLVRRAAIDSTGIGAMLAETLAAEFSPRVEPVTFTAARKEDLAYRTKRRMENRLSLLPDTRDVRCAFSAVKKLVTPSGNLRFDAARTAQGHADEFWAKALADLAAEEAPSTSAADAYLVTGAPIVSPQAFREISEGWREVF